LNIERRELWERILMILAVSWRGGLPLTIGDDLY
jgi:hypothetical protein